MSNIHLLSSIINDLENDLIKYTRKGSPNPGIVKTREKLIHQLTEVYENHKHLTLIEVFEQIQHDIDRVLKKDPELRGVVIVLPLRPGMFDAHKCGFISYAEMPKRKDKEPETYLDKDYYK
jgi:hypothetical protein